MLQNSSNMKVSCEISCFVTLLCCSKSPCVVPVSLFLGFIASLLYVLRQVFLILSLLGLASAYVVQLPAQVPLPLAYHSPLSVVPYISYPVVQPGYVAKTPGAEHYAPLPEGLAYASHHINIGPAPGTE